VQFVCEFASGQASGDFSDVDLDFLVFGVDCVRARDESEDFPQSGEFDPVLDGCGGVLLGLKEDLMDLLVFVGRMVNFV
jgi:hypothetical protein